MQARLVAVRQHPGYVLMRSIGRFSLARTSVREVRSHLGRKSVDAYSSQRSGALDHSLVEHVGIGGIVKTLRRDGVTTGLSLAPATVTEILEFARRSPSYIDRDPALGMMLDDRATAEAELGKPILLAQYFNTEVGCPTIAKLARDPALELIAAEYLGSIPRLVGVGLWWTFPVDATDEDRDRHAHLFHRDVDDFAFVKFFFYITDVDSESGPHVCIRGSHREPPHLRRSDHLRLRRYSDDEIESFYGGYRAVSIEGPAGTGFVEDTTCVHKGVTPTSRPRLVLQFEYALFDHGVMHDRRSGDQLAMVPAHVGKGC